MEAASHVVGTAFVVASLIVGDVILVSVLWGHIAAVVSDASPFSAQIYRVWIVWDRRVSMIVFPTLCICACIGTE